ncbi:hypothetical protein DERP_006006 [Dermatophagoides pteronyssinus]|uniref:Sema domain-containing protein n=1 Tax=Dermatophagoides pteronyssinus TaxID=6956 RepID=A0ABQ8JS11_DERPT|nr:hypothetical protein DERP_006006 [Dermatophagoides pteronyssinus]
MKLKRTAGNVFNFCNEAVKLNGSIPLRQQAAIVYDDNHTVLTAVAAGITGQHTVAFLGTNYGSIKKVLLTKGNYGEQFDEITIDPNQPILPDLFVDNEQNPQFLIAASPYKVVKLPIETCIQHNTCDQCLQARNPYCGWCSLQKRCTIKSECLYSNDNNQNHQNYQMKKSNTNDNKHYSIMDQKSVFSTPRWLSLETSQCIDFQAIKPEFISINLLAPVELIINQLPQLPYGANYLCIFEQQGQPIQAIVTRNGLICQTPPIHLRPKIPNGYDHINIDVSVRSSETDTDFIHRSFIYFDCSLHKSCKSCVTSAWDCNWCMHENLCTFNTSLCTRRMIVGENSAQNSLIKGVQHCPSFNIEQEIIIPDGQRRELTIEIRNLIPLNDQFQCIIEIEQAKERVQARISDNKIICNELMLSYQEEIGQQRASLTVLLNSDTFIDRTNFTIYKCQYLGAYAGRADCSLCQTRDNKFGCVWCQNQCLYNDQCLDSPVINSCPPPRIDYIHPISGPIEGGTLVSIEGSNLGSSFDEIKDRISIGGIPCRPIKYNISIRIVCRTGQSLIGPQSALVIIGNRAGIIELIDVNPKIGPQSGGTRIYLSGKNLNIGSNVAIYLDDLPCHVERSLASSYQMSCRTSAAPYSSYVVTRLILMIDGANYTLANPFLYTADPSIDHIEPLQSFFSGGRLITVIGSQFTSIQQPRMLVFVPRTLSSSTSNNQQQQQQIKNHYPTIWPPYQQQQHNNNRQSINHHRQQQQQTKINNDPNQFDLNIDNNRLINESLCIVLSSIKMLCQSPMINGDLQLLASNLSSQTKQNHNRDNHHQQRNHNNSTLHHIPNQIYLQIGFIMDNTISTLELDQYYPQLDSNILYVSDPIIYSVNNGHGKSIIINDNRINNDGINNNGDNILPFNGDVIVIEGENLAVLLLSEYELNVTIGQQRCNLTSVNMRQIICQPPIYPPPSPTDELGRRNSIELPAIVLKIGNMRRHLGYLHYSDYFYDNFNGQTNNNNDDSSRFYHQNHPPFNNNNNYGQHFETINNQSINLELLIVISIIIGTILTIISIIILAAYKHKTNEAEREYKRIQLQMDTLENNVRSECKQAFAELQTDILQANGLLSVDDLPKISLPMHDERTFLLRMFFASGTPWPSSPLSSSDLCKDNFGLNDGSNQQSLIINNIQQLKYNYLYQMFWYCSPYFNINNNNDNDNGDNNNAEKLQNINQQSFLIKSMNNNNDLNYHYPTNGSLQQPVENFYTINRSMIMKSMADNNQQQQQRPSIIIEQFEQLLLNQKFLLILINTLEQQTKTFSINDRLHFASLLTITLLDRMEYSFDIMRKLLSKLIDRFSLNKHQQQQQQHSNQLIKYNDSIVEKMLIDWLSICLYKYAREISSGPLFLLFSAIKHQIDKGPVDFVTGNSRYTLSEEKLLREQIDYKTLTVNIFLDEKLQQTLPPIISINNNNNNNHRSSISDRYSTIQNCRTATINNKHRRGIITGQQQQSSSTTTLRSINNRMGKKSMDYHHHQIGNDHQSIANMVEDNNTTTTNTTITPNSTPINSDDFNLSNNGRSGSGSGSGSGDPTSNSTDIIIDNNKLDDNNNDNNGYTCRILDCDTITQVKMKIIDTLYRFVPNVERPSVNDLQLYWKSLKPKQQQQQTSTTSSTSSSNPTNNILRPTPLINNNGGDYNGGTEASFNSSDHSQTILRNQSSITYQDVYGVASLMSKTDADKIYNASRRSDTISLEMTDILLDDYDHSTQILTANETIWRRLNTISHYGIMDGAIFYLCLRSSSSLLSSSASPTTTTSTKSSSSYNGDENVKHVNNPIVNNQSKYRYQSNIYNQDQIISNNIHGGNGGDIYNGNNSIANDDNTEFHLYEQIPADRNWNSNHNHQDSSLYDSGNGGTITNDNNNFIYNNNSQISSSSSLRRRQLPATSMMINYNHYNELPQQQYEPYIYQQQQRPLSSIFHNNQDEIYGLANHTNQSFINQPTKLLLQTNNQSSSSTYRLNSITMNNRSFARNTYKSSYFTLHNNNNRILTNQSKRFINNNQNDNDEQHNIWHLVKPSSLINDCIIGVSGGNFLYNNNHNDGKNRYNLRTMRQRRALRRRQQQQQQKPFSSLTPAIINILSKFTTTQQQQHLQLNSSISTYLINRSIPEIYLTRLLTTKGIIQQYIDDFFNTIFTVNEHLPIAIKWLFDFFDQEAMKNSINNPDTLISWKNNSLILRFWVTILRMPEILFDIQSNISIDICLDILAKNLIDTCETNLIINNDNVGGGVNCSIGVNNNNNLANQNNNNNSTLLGKLSNNNNSSTNKLLNTRDLINYQQIINQYYNDISLLPSIQESDIIAYMKDVSKTFEGKIQKEKSLEQLLSYCIQYKDEIFQSLSNDQLTQQEHLHLKFETIIYAAMATNHYHHPQQSQSQYGHHHFQQQQSQQQRTNGISRV